MKISDYIQTLTIHNWNSSYHFMITLTGIKTTFCNNYDLRWEYLPGILPNNASWLRLI